MSDFTHFDQEGNAVMVDVSAKEITTRTAAASGIIRVSSAILQAVQDHTSKKGDVLGVARIAGIMSAKKTSELIPLCHPLPLSQCTIDFVIGKESIQVICKVKTDGKTGVEMEALTGCSVALLTIYDMCKAIDKRMEIGDIHLVNKSGGKSGDFIWEK